MCFSELLSVQAATFSRCLCCLSLIYSLVLAVQAFYAQHSQASSDHWQLDVDHFKPQETSFYLTLSFCCALASAVTLTVTLVRNKTALWTALGLVCLATCVSLYSLTTCITSAPSHVIKNFMLVFDMWPFVVMACVLINALYMEDILKNKIVDWQYLTDMFTIELRK